MTFHLVHDEGWSNKRYLDRVDVDTSRPLPIVKIPPMLRYAGVKAGEFKRMLCIRLGRRRCYLLDTGRRGGDRFLFATDFGEFIGRGTARAICITKQFDRSGFWACIKQERNELLRAARTIASECECYCLDGWEMAGRGPCGWCLTKGAIHRVDHGWPPKKSGGYKP